MPLVTENNLVSPLPSMVAGPLIVKSLLTLVAVFAFPFNLPLN